MGVGDYVHSKEAGQPRAPDLGPSQRQLRAAQAKVEVPLTNVGNSNAHGRIASSKFLETRPSPHQPFPTHTENGVHRDAFDTDVEGVDDSTIAGTSVFGFDDSQSHAQSNLNGRYIDTSPRPSYLPRPSRHSRPSWFDGMGDKAMKKAGFDSDDADDTSSQVTSTAPADDEKTERQEQEQQPSSWYLAHKHRSTEEPLSKRLENFWSASKRAPRSTDQQQTDTWQMTSVETANEPSPPRKLGHMLPPTAARKIILPHSMSATPRTRFSPPKPSLLDQLDISPTRHGSEQPPQAGRTLSITTFAQPDHSDDEAGIDETIRLSSRRGSEHSSNIFGITNMSDLDCDESVIEAGQDPLFARSTSKRGRSNTVIHNNKRHLESDYSPQQLYQKSFTDLQAEPFEKAQTPSPPPIKSPSLPPEPIFAPNGESQDNAVFHLLNLTGQDRQSYLSRMTVDEWEDCGDQIIDQFSHLLMQMKKLRRARRQTARVFEDEIKRRHEQVETQNQDLSAKLDEMRTGGAEVLRGRNQ
ncbi:uncharacterized protein N7484_008280 [Penicillium longicatenatum]|uniref:uncharacterized protein n=1 Tax=Penicillium longicatenatum TaxID=1561947 RepID=UPI002547C90B|nr:uncharacterized protein N7484_008280 [Penicillium longicatenatum]KAJ5634967.1 hypothetical protein N7484_008280 [Penicillium longicatenatum]